MNADEELIRLLQAALAQGASPETRDWWAQYLRNVIEFRGFGIPQIRARLAQWRDDAGIAHWETPDQLRIALRLFESPVAEDKLAGILFLQEYLYDQFEWQALLTRYEQLYARDLIFDWNTCDWFCARAGANHSTAWAGMRQGNCGLASGQQSLAGALIGGCLCSGSRR